MRIAVTGAAGQLGCEIVPALSAAGHEPLAWTRAELDVTDPKAARRRMRETRPDAVIHTAAYTAVDRAEAEPEAARAVNADATGLLAEACAETGCALVYVSTDYVFDGALQRPYRPDDTPRPLNAYGASKLEGERRVRLSGAEWLIVRTSWLYGTHGSNFFHTIHGRAAAGDRLRVVDDQTGSPTWTRNLAQALVDLSTAGTRGILHVTDRTLGPGGEAGITWYAFARAILDVAGLDVPLEPVASAGLPRPARRPPYSVLDVTEAERRLGRELPPWRDGLRRMYEDWARRRSAAEPATAGAPPGAARWPLR